MPETNSAVVMTILQRDFPDVVAQINEQINQALPTFRMISFDKVPAIVNRFQGITETNGINWADSTNRVPCRLTGDEFRLTKVTEVRELMVGVMLMLYQPEKLLGLTNHQAKHGLLKHIADATECATMILSKSVTKAISYYKTYKNFKNEVDNLYMQIRAAGEFFE